MLCLYVAENMNKCLLTRSVCLREVSVSGGSTVLFKAVKSLHLVKFHQILFHISELLLSFFSTLQQFIKFPRWSMQTAKYSQG